jgi:DNA-directed RNA polymerase specialized sigma24 family protein
MTPNDQTDMGGTSGSFLTTHWSLIEGIRTQQDPDRAMIGLLLERYWKPVYCYLRRSGCDNEQAKDLTQGFFHEVVLNRRLIERADPSKSRFRTFLCHALKQYVIDTRRRETNQAHIPPDKLVSLEMEHLPTLPQTVSHWEPEECFTYAWKSAILDQTLSAVRDDCLRANQETHWQVFREQLLRPTLDGREPPSLKELCHRYGLASEKTASNMVITVKRRFQRLLKKHLRSTVGSDAEAEEELRDILETWHFGAQPEP